MSYMGNNKFFSNRVSSFMRARTRVSSRSLTKQAVAPYMALVVACRVIHTFAPQIGIVVTRIVA